MKIKTSKLTGPALDWAVAKGLAQHIDSEGSVHDAELFEFGCDGDTRLQYSTNWAHGGPIIDLENIDIFYERNSDGEVVQYWAGIDTDNKAPEFFGNTGLEAAMRCLVCSKLGDEVDIPEELCQQPNN